MTIPNLISHKISIFLNSKTYILNNFNRIEWNYWNNNNKKGFYINGISMGGSYIWNKPIQTSTCILAHLCVAATTVWRIHYTFGLLLSIDKAVQYNNSAWPIQLDKKIYGQKLVHQKWKSSFGLSYKVPCLWEKTYNREVWHHEHSVSDAMKWKPQCIPSFNAPPRKKFEIMFPSNK